MKFPQAPSTILMIRPASFGFNPQTAASNAFQQQQTESAEAVISKALAEFNHMVDVLIAHDVDVIVVDDSTEPTKPDAIFPNNWISFHNDGTIVLYPMLAENRRLERTLPVVDLIRNDFQVGQVIDLTSYEKKNLFLEGTGSIVFDYPNKIAYASRSPRTHEEVFNKLCQQLKFKPVLFDAVDESGQPIYHTNVLMCVGSRFAVICLDAIRNDDDQEKILQSFSDTNHQVVAISYQQLKLFAGNMIEIATKSGEPVVLISEAAFNSLLPGQINAITRHADMIPVSIQTIEQYGGGSVRCMVAGVFNKKLTTGNQ